MVSSPYLELFSKTLLNKLIDFPKVGNRVKYVHTNVVYDMTNNTFIFKTLGQLEDSYSTSLCRSAASLIVEIMSHAVNELVEPPITIVLLLAQCLQ